MNAGHGRRVVAGEAAMEHFGNLNVAQDWAFWTCISAESLYQPVPSPDIFA